MSLTSVCSGNLTVVTVTFRVMYSVSVPVRLGEHFVGLWSTPYLYFSYNYRVDWHWAVLITWVLSICCTHAHHMATVLIGTGSHVNCLLFPNTMGTFLIAAPRDMPRITCWITLHNWSTSVSRDAVTTNKIMTTTFCSKGSHDRPTLATLRAASFARCT